MAKKKVVATKAAPAKVVRKAAKPSAKLAGRPKPTGSKVVARKVTSPASTSPKATKAPVVASRKASVVKASTPSATVPQPVANSAPEVSLGRPLVTQEEKLYMLFHNDYHARQVFEFLRVDTVKELEQYTPQQIIHLLSKPIRTTVDRIRLRLAELNRSLREDEGFAAAHTAK